MSLSVIQIWEMRIRDVDDAWKLELILHRKMEDRQGGNA